VKVAKDSSSGPYKGEQNTFVWPAGVVLLINGGEIGVSFVDSRNVWL